MKFEIQAIYSAARNIAFDDVAESCFHDWQKCNLHKKCFLVFLLFPFFFTPQSLPSNKIIILFKILILRNPRNISLIFRLFSGSLFAGRMLFWCWCCLSLADSPRNLLRLRRAVTTRRQRNDWQKSFNYSKRWKSRGRKTNAYFALPWLASSALSIILQTIKKGLKINLFLCFSTFWLKYICTKNMFSSENFYRKKLFSSRPYLLQLSLWQLKHHKLSFNSRPSSTLFWLFRSSFCLGIV